MGHWGQTTRERGRTGGNERAHALFGLAFVAPLQIDIPFVDLPDFKQIFERGIDWILQNVTQALVDAMELILSVGFENYLFYPNPREIEVLNDLWMLSVSTFFGIAGLSFLYILLMAQFFPGRNEADLHYFLSRATKYLVVVFVSRELIAFFVAFTHMLAGAYYRSSIDLTTGADLLASLLEKFGVVESVVVVTIMSLVLFLAGVGLLLILIARMFVIYLTYALLPLLLGFQLAEVGPWNVVNNMGTKFIDATAKLMLFGIVVSALLWVGFSIMSIDGMEESDAAMSSTGVVDAGPDAAFAAASKVELIKRFLMFCTPLLMINFLGFKTIMSVL